MLTSIPPPFLTRATVLPSKADRAMRTTRPLTSVFLSMRSEPDRNFNVFESVYSVLDDLDCFAENDHVNATSRACRACEECLWWRDDDSCKTVSVGSVAYCAAISEPWISGRASPPRPQASRRAKANQERKTSSTLSGTSLTAAGEVFGCVVLRHLTTHSVSFVCPSSHILSVSTSVW